ncbi:hypothetical protein PoB_000641600 [Plakobranchus ocellatus]|uniref:Uncharacterized protein n=1 Tax=Plakobranchus ocellatus TaxID=259542 RepID=A0AAV3XY91_9GAST|nr:hypothetical protein PoB_000641600 [Plakobranchus ocellatus]
MKKLVVAACLLCLVANTEAFLGLFKETLDDLVEKINKKACEYAMYDILDDVEDLHDKEETARVKQAILEGVEQAHNEGEAVASKEKFQERLRQSAVKLRKDEVKDIVATIWRDCVGF